MSKAIEPPPLDAVAESVALLKGWFLSGKCNGTCSQLSPVNNSENRGFQMVLERNITKVTTLTNHNRSKECDEPIRISISNFSLVEKLARDLLGNHKAFLVLYCLTMTPTRFC